MLLQNLSVLFSLDFWAEREGLVVGVGNTISLQEPVLKLKWNLNVCLGNIMPS